MRYLDISNAKTAGTHHTLFIYLFYFLVGNFGGGG